MGCVSQAAEITTNGVHVFPAVDVFPHKPLCCPCHPQSEIRNGVPIHTHNFFSGADVVAAVERGEDV